MKTNFNFINVIFSIGTMIEPLASIFLDLNTSITRILAIISILSFVVLMYFQIVYSKNKDLIERFEKIAQITSSEFDTSGEPYFLTQLNLYFKVNELKKLQEYGYIKMVNGKYKLLKYF